MSNTIDTQKSRSQAKSGGEVADSNGYFYKGGQFLPSTQAEPGKWKIGKKWISSRKELVEPGFYAQQPTPFSRSIFSVIQGWCLMNDNKLELRENINFNGTPIVPETVTNLGVNGVQGTEEISFGELIDAYNKGARWVDVQPNAITITTADEGLSYMEAKKVGSNKDKCTLAEDGKSYGGKILGVTDFHVVQNLGLTAVIHQQAALDRIPEQDELVNIKYEGGVGVVEPRGNTLKPLVR